MECYDLFFEIATYLSLKDLSCYAQINKKFNQHGLKVLQYQSQNRVKEFKNTHLKLLRLESLGCNYDKAKDILIKEQGDFAQIFLQLNPFNLLIKDVKLVATQSKESPLLSYFALYSTNGDLVNAIMELAYPKTNLTDALIYNKIFTNLGCKQIITSNKMTFFDPYKIEY